MLKCDIRRVRLLYCVACEENCEYVAYIEIPGTCLILERTYQ